MRAPLLLLAAVALLAAGCGDEDGARKQGAALGDRAAGERLFAASGCGGCHTLVAARSRGRTGPDLDAAAPSAAEVLAQLRAPGGLMPSFAGELSEREMRDLAAFVDGATSGGTTVLEPTDRRFADCHRDDTPCVEEAFGNLTFNAGPQRALAELRRWHEGTPGGRPDCHRLAHRVGAAALARARGRIAAAFSAGDEICASGYFHGVVEQGFAGVPPSRVVATARKTCEDVARLSGFLEHQCTHGLGHGLMLHTDYDLPFSLKACDALPDRFGVESCAGGAFMEEFAPAGGPGGAGNDTDPDPIAPCRSAPERHKYACYLVVTIRILVRVDNDFRKAAAACRRSEPRWVGACFESYGRDVSGMAIGEPRQVLRNCALAGDHEADCLYGAVREIGNADADPRRAAALCRRVPAEHRFRCSQGVGAVIFGLETSVADRRAACRRARVPVARACDDGAGA